MTAKQCIRSGSASRRFLERGRCPYGGAGKPARSGYTRRSPTKVNLLVQERGSAWFAQTCICVVPFGYPGGGRDVYPGFLHLTGFMAMNLDRHIIANLEFLIILSVATAIPQENTVNSMTNTGP